MKWGIVILLSGLLSLLCACGTRPYPSSLLTADSLIRPILHYYIKEGDPRLLPDAYYYAGRVYRDLGDAPQALDYFEQSLEAMRKHENLEVKNKVYAQMGTLFLYQDMYPEALKVLAVAYKKFQINGFWRKPKKSLYGQYIVTSFQSNKRLQNADRTNGILRINDN